MFGGGIAPQIALDGQHGVYSQGAPGGGPEALHMLTIQSDALGDNALDTQTPPVGWGWSPDSLVYACTVVPDRAVGKGYATGPGVESPYVFVDNLTAVRALRWIDSSHLVFIGQISGGGWAFIGSNQALSRQRSKSSPAG